MTCEACTLAAVKPLSGLYLTHCIACQTRWLAKSPAHFEAIQARKITPAYKAALRQVFGRGWEAGHAAVKALAQRG